MSDETIACMKCGKPTGVKARPGSYTEYPSGGFTYIPPLMVICKACRELMPKLPPLQGGTDLNKLVPDADGKVWLHVHVEDPDRQR